MYTPNARTTYVLDRAWESVNSVPYTVTARWVFYRLLQEGTLHTKKDYKRLLGYLSKARKEFYGQWRPDTLSDDTRAPILMQRGGYYTLYCRGHAGFSSGYSWLKTVRRELNCPLDRWQTQPNYVEVWFEASAMQSQFLHYCHESVPLLAFHGDISIPAKWECATRIWKHWERHKTPIKILYFGDYDEKGLQIPQSARRDVVYFVTHLIARSTFSETNYREEVDRFLANFSFERVGINEDQIDSFDIPENPERPGTYQWEGIDDVTAESLIGETDKWLDMDAFAAIEEEEAGYRDQFVEAIKGLEVE